MKISIVSVAFNEEKNIAKTIESVLCQTSTDYEYIICDGKSTDKTVEIAQSYREKFEQKGIKYIVNSEKDNGIFDGMNKGIDLASGDYIYFLNAGDRLYSNGVIEKIVAVAKENNAPDVIYGNVMCIERDILFETKAKEELLLDHMSICHQGTFASLKLMKQRKFDLKYSVAGDYNFLLGLKLDGYKFCGVDLIIAYYDMGGVSTKNVFKCYTEQALIKESYNLKVDYKQLKKDIRKNKRAIKIKSLIPKKLWVFWSTKIKKKQLAGKDF